MAGRPRKMAKRVTEFEGRLDDLWDEFYCIMPSSFQEAEADQWAKRYPVVAEWRRAKCAIDTLINTMEYLGDHARTKAGLSIADLRGPSRTVSKGDAAADSGEKRRQG